MPAISWQLTPAPLLAVPTAKPSNPPKSALGFARPQSKHPQSDVGFAAVNAATKDFAPAPASVEHRYAGALNSAPLRAAATTGGPAVPLMPAQLPLAPG